MYNIVKFHKIYKVEKVWELIKKLGSALRNIKS